MKLQHIDIIAGNLSTQEISKNYPGAGYGIAVGVKITGVESILHGDSNDNPFKTTTNATNISFLGDIHISLGTGVDYKGEIVKGSKDRIISIDLIHSDIQKQHQEISSIASCLNYIFINEDQYGFLKENIPLFSLNPHIILLILSDNEGVEIISKGEKNKLSPVFSDEIEIRSSMGAKDVFIGAFLGLKKSGFDIVESVKLASLLSQKSMTDYGVDHLIKPLRRPKIILIVGPSGAGKTTFTNTINEEYECLNDLYPLKEVFLIDGSEEISKIDENSILYFKDYLTKRKGGSNSIFSQFNGDGYDILEPEVWDEILSIGFLVGILIYRGFAFYGLYAHFDIPLMTIIGGCLVAILLLNKSQKIHELFQLSDITILEKGIYDFLASNAVYESPEEVKRNIYESINKGLSIEKVELLDRAIIKKYPLLCRELISEKQKNIPLISKKESQNEQDNGGSNEYLAEIEDLGELFVPIYIEKELAYILVLPEKNSQANYTSNEKRLINTMRPKIALSMQILEYNQTLREEVERQTLQINEQKIKLEESYKKLEALDHEKDVFMNMAAHELRTPMTIIRGYADILLDGGSGTINEAQKKLVENMYKSSESLIALVNDLLDLSRIDAGKMELKYEICDIKELVRGTFESFGTLMEKKSMNFSLKETLDTQYDFTTDRAKLTLLFNNLISNAYKYTPEKGNVQWNIGTEIRGNEPWLHFSVTDTGVGIPEAELPHVFDRFASISTHNNITSTIQSTGLGLSIVKKIVVGMGGAINVTSIVGKGSTFSIELPYTPKPKKLETSKADTEEHRNTSAGK